ncbi:MAG: hypothetical protein AB1458_16530 [Bacteroidota bacterium]
MKNRIFAIVAAFAAFFASPSYSETCTYYHVGGFESTFSDTAADACSKYGDKVKADNGTFYVAVRGILQSDGACRVERDLIINGSVQLNYDFHGVEKATKECTCAEDEVFISSKCVKKCETPEGWGQVWIPIDTAQPEYCHSGYSMEGASVSPGPMRNCVYKPKIGNVIKTTMVVDGEMAYASTGETCDASSASATTNETSDSDDPEIVNDDSGRDVCIGAKCVDLDAPNCGEFNGEYLCVSKMPSVVNLSGESPSDTTMPPDQIHTFQYNNQAGDIKYYSSTTINNFISSGGSGTGTGTGESGTGTGESGTGESGTGTGESGTGESGTGESGTGTGESGTGESGTGESGDGDGEGDGAGSAAGLAGPPGVVQPESWWEKKYPNGVAGVFNDFMIHAQSTPLFGLAGGFTNCLPSSGSCPSWVFSANLGGNMNFGSFELQPPCWIWDAIKGIMIFSALLLARRLIFGG